MIFDLNERGDVGPESLFLSSACGMFSGAGLFDCLGDGDLAVESRCPGSNGVSDSAMGELLNGSCASSGKLGTPGNSLYDANSVVELSLDMGLCPFFPSVLFSPSFPSCVDCGCGAPSADMRWPLCACSLCELMGR